MRFREDGYAVAAHGHTRPTFDVDFLARKTDRAEWQRRADAAGLKLAFETQAFAQFEQADGDGFDIMFVNDATFAQLFENSMEYEFDGARARVPSLDHLLALKIHALKDQPPHRTSKDAEDVEMLARRNQLDLAQPKYSGFSSSVERAKSTQRSSESCGIKPGEERDLELPRSNHRGLPPLVSIPVMMRRIKELRRMFPRGVPSAEERRARKSVVPFEL